MIHQCFIKQPWWYLSLVSPPSSVTSFLPSWRPPHIFHSFSCVSIWSKCDSLWCHVLRKYWDGKKLISLLDCCLMVCLHNLGKPLITFSQLWSSQNRDLGKCITLKNIALILSHRLSTLPDFYVWNSVPSNSFRGSEGPIPFCCWESNWTTFLCYNSSSLQSSFQGALLNSLQMNYFLHKICESWGWGNGSVGKVFAVQIWGPKFKFSDSIESWVVACACNLSVPAVKWVADTGDSS